MQQHPSRHVENEKHNTAFLESYWGLIRLPSIVVHEAAVTMCIIRIRNNQIRTFICTQTQRLTLKAEVYLNYILKYSSYPTEDLFLLHYNIQPVHVLFILSINRNP